MRGTRVNTLLLVVAAVVSAAAAPAPAAPAALRGHPGVRTLSPNAVELLEEAARRSSLVRSQLDVIDASDLTVYVKETFQAECGEPRAKLQFVSAAGGRRYVLVSVDRWKLSWEDRMVLLAHELQHAVEIALAPDVRDSTTFRALFRRIGWEMKSGRFETEAACQATFRMRADLDMSRIGRPAAAFRPPQAADESGRDSRRNRRDP